MSDSDTVCERHGVESLPTGYDRCPYCVEEEKRNEQMVERAMRQSDPQMADNIDAQANAIDHSRRPDY